MIRPPVFVMLVLVATPLAAAEQYHVYLLGGQSNGTGRGNAADIPAGSPLADPQTDVAFWYRNTLSGSSNNTLPESQLIDLAPGSGHGKVGPVYSVEIGPEVAFGRTLADALPDQNILIIKGSRGGSNLHTGWSATGTDYLNFVQTVNAALAAVTSNGDTYVMSGMIWVQGEADVGSAGSYQSNLIDLIDRVRNDVFDGEDAPFVLSQLSDNQYTSLTANHETLRAAQAAIPGLVVNAATVFTDDDALFTTRPGDRIHFDANGQINLGTALANETVALQAIDMPEPTSAIPVLVGLGLILAWRTKRRTKPVA